MTRSHRLLSFLSALITPLSAMLYLYHNNTEYLDFTQVLFVSGAMAIVSALGYLLFRSVFRSSLSGFMGCLVCWVAFFAYGPYTWNLLRGFLGGGAVKLIVYGLATLLLAFLLGFLFRKARRGGEFVFFIVFILTVMNGVPAVSTYLSLRGADGELWPGNTAIAVDESTQSPNVWWLHLDGMLGFDAFESYFGDDQAAFKEELRALGFSLNEGAMLESGHKTAVAVPSMMSPKFYDERLSAKLKTHEEAQALRDEVSYLRGEVEDARYHNEVREAFDRKGYTTQTVASFNTYYPPVTDNFFLVTEDGASRVYLSADSATFKASVNAFEMSNLLIHMQSGAYSRLLPKALDLLPSKGDMRFEKLQDPLPGDERRALLIGEKGDEEYGPLFDAIREATAAEGPAFTIVFDLAAHSPFVLDENGEPNGGDGEDIRNYAGQHRYAAKLIVNAVKMILAKDPDAVIVLAADHGLHRQEDYQIEAAFGKDAVLPIWNQVLSGLRVPERYKTGEEEEALATPLNMGRYLINAFVGKNYAYLSK